jgi:hypothetical protein
MGCAIVFGLSTAFKSFITRILYLTNSHYLSEIEVFLPCCIRVGCELIRRFYFFNRHCGGISGVFRGAEHAALMAWSIT